MSIPVIIALSFDVDDPEQVADLMTAIDPPQLPGFAGTARVVVGDDVADVVAFLDGWSAPGRRPRRGPEDD